MRRTLIVALAIAACLTATRTGPTLSGGLPSPRGTAGVSATLLYIAGGHLRLRPIDGRSVRIVRTPWSMALRGGNAPGVQWSPDARRVALDDTGERLAVINLATDRITILLGRHCVKDCTPPTYAWSPNGRYLALIQPIGGSQSAVLRVWDSGTGKTSHLLNGVSAYVAYPVWSHDSTRIAVALGRFDETKNLYPDAATVDLAGHVVRLGKGDYFSWSPDDRFLGIIRPNFCGANTCDEDELLRGSAGGPAVLLARHASSLFDNPIWAPQSRGYAFDRWLLNAAGTVTRRLAGPHERILSWKRDGTRVALQTYHPYQSNPDTLYLSTPAGKRDRVYRDGRNAGCGACSKDVYGVSWGSGDVVAFSTPTYPTPKNVTVYPRFFVRSTSGGPSVRIGIPASDTVNILGFVGGNREIIIHAGKTVYRYTIGARRLDAVVTGIAPGYTTAVLDPIATGVR